MGIIFSFFVLGLYSILSVLGLFCLIKPNYLYIKGKSYSRLAIFGFNIALFVIFVFLFTLTVGLSPTPQSELDKVSGWGTLALLLGLVFAIVCWVKVHQNYKSNVAVRVIKEQEPTSSPIQQNAFITHWHKLITDLKEEWKKIKQEVEEKERLKKAKKKQAEQEKRVAKEIEALRNLGNRSSSISSTGIKKWDEKEWDDLINKTREQVDSLGTRNNYALSSEKYDSFDDDLEHNYDDLEPEFEIEYRDFYGSASTRKIAIINVDKRDKNLTYVVAYCFSAHDKRTFRLDRLVCVTELANNHLLSDEKEMSKVFKRYIKPDL